MAKARSAAPARAVKRREPPAPVLRSPALALPLAQIQRVSDAVVEGATLTAVVSVPLYFSLLTSSGYEPDKAILLRLFAVAAAAAWLVGFLTRARSRQIARRAEGETDGQENPATRGLAARLRSAPLMWAAVFVFVAYIIATIFSIDFNISLWGSDTRQAGLWTRAAYLIFFLAAATRLRDREQVQRLVSVLLFGSVPAVAYGLIQQGYFDPIPAGGDPTTLQWPVRSTFGQHVFFGSYLVVLIPLTASRLVERWQDRDLPSEGRASGDELLLALTAVGFSVLSFFLIMALAEQRPALTALFPGIMAGYALIALMLHGLPDYPPLRKARLWGYAALLALQILTLVLTGARGAYLGFFASIPVFGILLAWRLRRPRIWQTMLAATLAIGLVVTVLNIPGGPLEPLRHMHALSRIANITESGGTEGSAQGRLLIWQGVVHMMATTPRIGSNWGGIGRDIVGYGPESMHWAFQKVFPLKLRQVTGEIWTWDRAHNIYLDYLVDAGLLGLLGFLAVLGLLAKRLVSALLPVDRKSSWILIGIGASIAAYLVDGLFGLGMAVSFLLFWLFAGLVAGAPWRAPGAEGASRSVSLLFVSLFWAGVGLSAVIFLLAPGLADLPDLLSALWLISGLVGVGLLAAAVLPPEEAGTSSGRHSTGRVAAGSARGGGRWSGRGMAIPAAIVLVAGLGAAAQMRFETAAFANRDGLTHLAAGDQAGGLGYLQEATRANAYDAVYDTQLGGSYLSIGANHGDSALPGYHPGGDDARTIDPQKAITLGHDQLFALAQQALQDAHNLTPLDPDTYNNLGTFYLQSNRPAQAIAEFRAGEAISPHNPKFLDQIALTQLQQGRLQPAHGNARTAFNLDPAYWYTYYALAQIDHKLGNTPLAKQEASSGLQLAALTYPPVPDSQKSTMESIKRSG